MKSKLEGKVALVRASAAASVCRRAKLAEEGTRLIASVAGLCGNAGQSGYSAAKAGITGLTMTFAKECGRYEGWSIA